MSVSQFLDTNVIVYAYDTSDVEKQATAQSVLSRAVRQGDGMISAQILGEFFQVVVVKRKLMTTSEALSVIVALSGGLKVASITPSLVADAIALHERYQLRYWDALVVATAKHAGCTKVISEDMSDGQDYSGITVSNPFKP